MPKRMMTARNSSGRNWRRMSARRSIFPPSTRPRRSPSSDPADQHRSILRGERRWRGAGRVLVGEGPGPQDASTGAARGRARRRRRGPRGSRACEISGIGRGWTVRPGSLTPSTQLRAHERVDDLGIELDAGELAQLAERLLGGERRHPVRALGGHRLERVRDVEDPGQERDLVADQPVRVARAVVPLVVVADDRQLAAPAA